MKYFVLLGLLVILFAQKTGKIGYVQIDSVIVNLSEYSQAQQEIQNHAIELQKIFDEMTQEYQKKLKQLQEEGETMGKLKKEMLAEDIANLEKKIQDFQTRGQQELQKKQVELLEPLIKRARELIAEVAKEFGYKMIFEKSALLYPGDAEDILPIVIQKIQKSQVKTQDKQPEKKQ